jgi:hypothetical protein
MGTMVRSRVPLYDHRKSSELLCVAATDFRGETGAGFRC